VNDITELNGSINSVSSWNYVSLNFKEQKNGKREMIRKKLLVLGLCLPLFSSGAIAEKLEKDTVIQGIKCAKGYVDFYESGKLKSATLGTWDRNTGRYTPIQIQGMKIQGGEIKLYESGKLKEIIPRCWSYQIKIQRIWFCKRIEFYESEKIKISKAFLSNNETIQGIKCKGGSDYYIVFYESGKLKNATLVENQIIQGIECWEGRDVELYESGKIKKTYLVIVKATILQPWNKYTNQQPLSFI